MKHEITRLNRLKEVKKILKKHKKIDDEKLVAELCMAWGIMRRTALEYIKTVRVAQDVPIQGS